jgi:exodeoxyribonuclease VII large subunit
MLPDAAPMGVSEFVALLNQTFEYAFPSVTITGELANLRVSKNKWVYFDLKDEGASVKFFATVFQLPGPLEDGMLVNVRGTPKLHNLYGFSVTAQSIQPTGEGAIKRAQELLHAKLLAEGLFDANRKRTLPYPPLKIGLITSGQSAAYADFVKVLSARWGGVDIHFVDVQVQGQPAILQITRAIEHINGMAKPPEIIVIIRGGGSADDLAAFSTEQVTRAVAASRVPTMVAIGHEVDFSLAELAADVRASTPSNAAELLVPDRATMLHVVRQQAILLNNLVHEIVRENHIDLTENQVELRSIIERMFVTYHDKQANRIALLQALNPTKILNRGYAIVRSGGILLKTTTSVAKAERLSIELASGTVEIIIKNQEQ